VTDITKKVNRGVPVNQRSVRFTETDAVTGDVLLVKDSLSKSASHVTIESEADGLRVRLNVYHTVFPLRQVGDGLDADNMGFQGPNLALGQVYQDDTNAMFVIDQNETLTFDDDLPIDDIELITISGDFTITCI
jgi:hypothetical protein